MRDKKLPIFSLSTLQIWFKNHQLLALAIAFFIINLIAKSFSIATTPPVLTFDEMYYSTEAQTLILDGHGPDGRWQPWNLAPANSLYSELTGTTLVPGFLLFPHNPIVAIKMMAIILGSVLPILMALITYRLTKSRWVFFATLLVATLNPWIFEFSRMSFDSLYSVVFYLMGVCFLLYFKNWQKLWSLVPFFWGFYQYQGHKPLLVPIVGLTVLYLLMEKLEWPLSISHVTKVARQKSTAILLAVLGVCLALTVMYVVRLPHLSSSVRIHEFSVFDQAQLSSKVNLDRRVSFANPLMPIFSNKLVSASQEMLQRFIDSYDLKWIFLQGNEAIDTFSVTQTGFLYLSDIILIVAGFVYLWSNRRLKPAAVFLSLLLLVGSLTNVIRVDIMWITFRGAFVFMALVLLAGVGGGMMLRHLPNWLKAGLIGLYLISTSFFFYTYFFRYPIASSINNYFYDRVLASYMERKPHKNYIVVADSPVSVFNQILTYDHQFTKANLPQIRQAYQNTVTNKLFKLNNLTIQAKCPTAAEVSDANNVIVIDYRWTCPGITTPGKESQINSIVDSGAKYSFYNEDLCSSYPLERFSTVDDNKFDVSRLNNSDFCSAFFKKQL